MPLLVFELCCSSCIHFRWTQPYLFKEKKDKNKEENCTTADSKRRHNYSDVKQYLQQLGKSHTLFGVSPVQTGVRCARNHRKPWPAACLLPAPPRAEIRQEELMMPSFPYATQGRQTTHLTLRDSGQGAATSRRQAIRRHGRNGGLSPRILLHCHELGM